MSRTVGKCVLAGVLFLVLCSIGFLARRSGVYLYDIDVNSGRLRTQHYLTGLKLSEWIKETPFSKLASGYALTKEPPDWRRASEEICYELMPWSYSVQRDATYGTAKFVCLFYNSSKVAPDERKTKVAGFLRAMQDGDLETMAAWRDEALGQINSLPPPTPAHR